MSTTIESLKVLHEKWNAKVQELNKAPSKNKKALEIAEKNLAKCIEGLASRENPIAEDES